MVVAMATSQEREIRRLMIRNVPFQDKTWLSRFKLERVIAGSDSVTPSFVVRHQDGSHDINIQVGRTYVLMLDDGADGLVPNGAAAEFAAREVRDNGLAGLAMSIDDFARSLPGKGQP